MTYKSLFLSSIFFNLETMDIKKSKQRELIEMIKELNDKMENISNKVDQNTEKCSRISETPGKVFYSDFIHDSIIFCVSIV